MNVVYIGSQSRSGSTICDLVIGQIAGVLSLGELKVFDREMRGSARCSCGQDPCSALVEIHRQMADRLGETYGEAERDLLRLRGLPAALLSKARRSKIRDYFCALHDVLDAALEEGCFVDSSKCPVRLFWYRMFFPGTVGYVRLVRAPSQVATSLSKPWGRKSQAKGQQVDFFGQSKVKTYAGWVLSNLLFNALGGRPDVVMSYEDMARAPSVFQAEIAQSLGLDPIDAGTQIRDTGHIIAGSRWRLAESLQVKEAEGPSPTSWDRRLIGLFVRRRR